ncbi:superoxide dismutase family protein [Pseudomonas mangrovi]|uniref:Superoxide dismutase [Cu-Zn] n=1 Tax=Pseudomonas mangrovi TaxID=2161748 RepID=A0A2T5P6E9_9PSED|nr:superoxide dismutase family protein [Pseudomonas mangrovi]PTU73293.1 superoxide dismutase [Cu-Zn] SodC1 [Pseudomonas mangrovi]
MRKWLFVALAGCTSLSLQAAPLSIEINQVSASGVGSSLGRVTIEQTAYGLLFTPTLKGLEPGLHGFHVHTNPSCAPAEKDGKPSAAEGAGGHWDPEKTGKHGHPWDDNAHKGDLPALHVATDGSAQQPVLAPRLKSLDEIRGHAIMLHAGGDNHADHPMPLGGGGARIACGVIE